MEASIKNLSALKPEQREAAEKLLGRSLADLQNAVIRIAESGGEIVIRILSSSQLNTQESKSDGWAIPACFRVLDDLTDEQSSDYDTTTSQPVRLTRPI